MSRCGAITLPIVQIHPTRHCNLRCRHCYSLSGPAARGGLDPAAITRFLREARAEGYAIASFSGGEPLIYPHLFECMDTAAGLGLASMVATNGMLIDNACARRLAATAGLIAVSVDGPPDMHNSIRESAAAFEGTLRGIAALREAGANFGIIHTVTAKSLPHLRWLMDFAREQGAGLLQLHPLEAVGRAERQMPGEAPDAAVATRAFLIAAILAEEFGESPALRIDVLNRDALEHQPELVFADDGEQPSDAPLSALVNPLVLEQDGSVVPLAYGFGRAFQVCNVMDETLREALPRFRSETYPRFRTLCRNVRAAALAEEDLPYLTWYERLTRSSCEPGTDPMRVVDNAVAPS